MGQAGPSGPVTAVRDLDVALDPERVAGRLGVDSLPLSDL